MLEFLLAVVAAVRVFSRRRQDTALEILALRQQLAVLKRKRPRPRLNPLDRLFWTALRRFWSRWAEVLVVVKPQTVVGWHRAGFRLFWKWPSRPSGGRPKSTPEIRALIRRLAHENPNWGAPKIHGELQKLGFVVSERTVARYLSRIRRRGDAGDTWRTFLANHREALVAFDFFTVPTATFQLLYCFVIIEHERRRILHCNVTLTRMRVAFKYSILLKIGGGVVDLLRVPEGQSRNRFGLLTYPECRPSTHSDCC